MHILVVEDDPRLGRMLRRLLGDDRHVVELARTAEEATELLESEAALDVLILDLGLPDRSGLEVLREMRGHGSDLPVMILTARDAIEDRVRGLDAGADDYLVKPFAYEELAARLRALARRADHAPSGPNLVNGPIVLDEADRAVSVGGAPVALSPREFALLECFLRNTGRLLTRDNLLDAAWPYGLAVTPNTVEAYVHRLREKLGVGAGTLIRTERGIGYRMVSG
ncbi:MAG: response regulator transcription factor [Candidatus Limnocylindrales bacterium]